MRRTLLVLATLAAAALAACDQAAFPTVAGLGGGTGSQGTGTGGGSGTGGSQSGTGTGGGSVVTLTITPPTATIVAGTSIQLITNVFDDQVRWESLNPTVAGVSPSGMVVGLTAGVAPIRVVLLADTTRQAQAVITVLGRP